MSYSYIMDAFQSFYSGIDIDRIQFLNRIEGDYAGVYWGMVFCNCVLPLLLCLRSMRASHLVLIVIAMGSLIGMWLERFNIVVMSLPRTNLPSAWGGYTPTFWDWAVFGGTIGLFLTGFLIALRVVPIVSMFEMRELLARRGQR